MKVLGLDHIAFKSPDVDRSLGFYCGVLGLEGDRIEEWEKGLVKFPSVRLSPETIFDIFSTTDQMTESAHQQVDHVCFAIEPGTLDELIAEVESFGLCPSAKQARWGAQGMGESVYVIGTEGGTIELRHYPN